MAKSTTQLANIALQRAQCGQRLTSFDSDTFKEAQQARDVYDTLRQTMLRENLWGFAKKRVQLAQLGSAPVFGYDHAYGLPADYLRLISVHPYNGEGVLVKYHLETLVVSLTNTRAIITNADQCWLRYVYDVETLSSWDADFYDAFAWRMSVEFALNIKKSAQLAQGNMAEYRKAISLAKSTGGVEAWPEPYPESFPGSWVSEHDGGNGTSFGDEGW
jgi:hypothetical protein